MLKLGRKVEYALISLLHLDSLGDGGLATSREIAELYSIPPDVLGKVLQVMNRSNLVRSVQGAKGGYQLQRPLEVTVLGDVIQAIDGPVHLAPCTADESSCARQDHCNIKAPVFHFQDELLKFLYNFSLSSFSRHAQDHSIAQSTAATIEGKRQ